MQTTQKFIVRGIPTAHAHALRKGGPDALGHPSLKATAHGLGAGTDGRSPTMLAVYIVTSSSIVFLTTNRVLTAARLRARTRAALAR